MEYFYTAKELAEMAAVSWGISQPLTLLISPVQQLWYAELGRYGLDQQRFKGLEEKGFLRIESDNTLALREQPSGKEWSFLRISGGQFNQRFELGCVFRASSSRRGILMFPHVRSTLDFPPSDDPSQKRLLRALDNVFDEMPVMTRDFVHCSTEFLMSWERLGLAGIRSLKSLFWEFVGLKSTITHLVDTGWETGLFRLNPDPFGRDLDNNKPELFVIESHQPAVLADWQRGIKEFQKNLTPEDNN